MNKLFLSVICIFIFFGKSFAQQEYLSKDSIDYYQNYIQKNLDNLRIKSTSFIDTARDETVTGYVFNPNSIEVDKQIKYVNKLIRHDSNRIDFQFMKPYIFLKAGMHAEMITALDELLNYSIQNKNKWFIQSGYRPVSENEFLNGLILYVEETNWNKDENGVYYAQKIADLSRKYYPGKPIVSCLFGLVDYKFKNYSSAIDHFQKALEREPENIGFKIYLFDAYLEIGDKEKMEIMAEEIEISGRRDAIDYINLRMESANRKRENH